LKNNKNGLLSVVTVVVFFIERPSNRYIVYSSLCIAWITFKGRDHQT